MKQKDVSAEHDPCNGHIIDFNTISCRNCNTMKEKVKLLEEENDRLKGFNYLTCLFFDMFILTTQTEYYCIALALFITKKINILTNFRIFSYGIFLSLFFL